MAVGEKAIVADPLEAIGKHVLQKPADELMCFQTHDFLHATMSVIAPAEGDMGVAERDKAAVRDGNTVGVARQIGEPVYRLRSVTPHRRPVGAARNPGGIPSALSPTS